MANLMKPEASNEEVQRCIGQIDALANEIRTAIRAIGTNALPALEESVQLQGEMAAGLGVTMARLRDARSGAKATQLSQDMSSKLLQKVQTLSGLSEEYAVLLQHSGHSMRLLRALHGRDAAHESLGHKLESGSPWHQISSWEG